MVNNRFFLKYFRWENKTKKTKKTCEEWIPLSESTPSENIPRNCRVRVNLLMIPSPNTSKTAPRGSSVNNNTLSPATTSAAASSASPEEQGGIKKETAATDSETAATFSDSAADPSRKGAGQDVGVMLALPWRRFDRDLGMARDEAEEGEGLEVCGRRLAVGDVSNSDEGTGLFTWVREGAGAFSFFL